MVDKTPDYNGRRQHMAVLTRFWLFQTCSVLESCTESEHTVSYCDLYHHVGPWYLYFRSIFQCVVFFVLPLIIIVVLYVIIIKTLLKNEPMSPQISGITNHLGGLSAWSRQLKARKRVAKTVFAMVALFVVCWLPAGIFTCCGIGSKIRTTIFTFTFSKSSAYVCRLYIRVSIRSHYIVSAMITSVTLTTICADVVVSRAV